MAPWPGTPVGSCILIILFRIIRQDTVAPWPGTPVGSCILIILYVVYAPLSFKGLETLGNTMIPKVKIEPMIANNHQ